MTLVLVERLPPREKMAFVLKHFEHLKIREISVVMNISEGTVKSFLHRAVVTLREGLSRDGRERMERAMSENRSASGCPVNSEGLLLHIYGEVAPARPTVGGAARQKTPPIAWLRDAARA